jgi:hypothetical protein
MLAIDRAGFPDKRLRHGNLYGIDTGPCKCLGGRHHIINFKAPYPALSLNPHHRDEWKNFVILIDIF